MFRVRLRQATVADIELLESWQQPEYIGEFNTFDLPARALGDAIRKTGLVGEDRGALIVEVTAGGRPIGSVSWHAEMYGPNPESVAWNIGINLIPEARGQGFGAEAQRLLADRLFATTGVNRVEAMTDVENHAEQRALEKAGFTREGVLRGAQFRAGAWHDIVVYSMLRPA
ncbi:MAG TPA: GNAT family protein [Candidatus Dormibacteraeota bacterium]|nr:GNAT family protein [Candidatus Dormibacteraeota bacterium]